MLFLLNIIIFLLGAALHIGGGILTIVLMFYFWYYSEERLIKKNHVKIIPKDLHCSQTELLLHDILDRLSAKARVRKPRLGIAITMKAPNAVTVGRNRRNSTIILSIGYRKVY